MSAVLRLRMTAAAAAAAALFAGSLAAVSPKLAVGAVAGVLVVVLALRAPVVHLVLLVALAVLVPVDTLNRFSVGGGVGAFGLWPTDVLLLTGFLRVALELPDEPLEIRRTWFGGGIVAFLALCVLQLWHGLRAGYPPADVAAEFRELLGFGVVLLALPIVGRDDQLRRLLRGLIVVGILLGLWGIYEWVFHLQFTGAAKATAGSHFDTAGRAVGLYGFPVAIVLSLAALTSGHVRRPRAQAALVAVAALNLAALALTFERTFWLGMAVGLLYLIARSSWSQRVRLLVGVPLVALGVVVVMSLVAPAELRALGHRLGSVTRYGNDPSVTYRQVESRMVETHIAAHPIAGSGLGASMLIGRPGTTVQPMPRRLVEDGYLWLLWKLGLPLAALLLTILLSAVVWPQRGPPSLMRAVRVGSQAAVVALCASAAAFSIFDSTAGPVLFGLLLALIATPSSAVRAGLRDLR